MTNLFIIGNGFDISHGLATRYEDFKDYLIREHGFENPLSNFSQTVPGVVHLPDGDTVYDKIQLVKFIYNTILNSTVDDTWSNFEDSLGELNFSDYLSDIDELSSHTKEHRLIYNNEDVSNLIIEVMPTLQTLFTEWIETIDTSEAKKCKKFSSLINPERDKFLNFNYTDTLQILYGVTDVFHPHGEAVNGEIVFGHGSSTTSLYDMYLGADYVLNELHQIFYKNTHEIIQDNDQFFRNLNNITNIYSYGFSFSNTDKSYITKICESIDTRNTIWNIHNYGGQGTISTYSNRLIDGGFLGTIKTFDI